MKRGEVRFGKRTRDDVRRGDKRKGRKDITVNRKRKRNR